jgi:hypothetical protein
VLLKAWAPSFLRRGPDKAAKANSGIEEKGLFTEYI